ncbi:MAG: Ig-like domain-containing protein [Patescibacteria group bacterium]
MEGETKIKIRKARIYILWTAVAVFFLLIMGFIFINQPLRPTLVIEKIDDLVKVNSPLEIQFDWPVSRQAEITFEPELTGELTYKNMVIGQHFSRTVVFTPTLNFWPETTYKITISNVKNALPSLLAGREYTFTFTTEKLPEILSVTPDVTAEIQPDSEFEVSFDKSRVNLADYEFIIAPAVTADIEFDEGEKNITIKPQNLLSQGQTYQFSVWQKTIRNYYQKNETAFQSEPERKWEGSFKVREAPYLSQFLPAGQNVSLAEKISLIFNEPVNINSVKEKISILPELAGEWETDDQQTYIYKTDSLAKDTEYTVKISQGLKTLAGGYFTEDSNHTFKTVGPVKLSHSTPADGSVGVSVGGALKLVFDQNVDHLSAQSHFSIKPAKEGDFSWEGEVMIFRPKSALSFNTVYQVTMSKGVKGEGGFDSEKDFSVSFATELSVTKLSVVYHHQEHNLSCEIATLVMALAYRGVNVLEATIINYIGFDPTPKSNGVWGNPNVAFVGDIDGRQPSTGYGVYWDPIARAANQYRKAYAFTAWSVADLTAEIKKGNPVIVWGTAGSGARIDWKTPQGGNVVAVSGEHTRLVIGFIGSAENPSTIITLDPLSGERHFTASSFLWNWGLLGRSGVVVE